MKYTLYFIINTNKINILKNLFYFTFVNTKSLKKNIYIYP